MRRIGKEDLKCNQILDRPILSEDGSVLIHSDVKLTGEMIKRIKNMNIQEVFIRGNEVADSQTSFYKHDETARNSKVIISNILEKHIYKHNDELKKIGMEAVRIMDSVIEEPEILNNITEIRNISTDMYTHCINVCSLSTIMALRLKMNEKQVRNVSIGAILHDIGLRYINAPYINIDEKSMSPNDALEYKKHTIYGYSSIESETWIPQVSKEIILLHHEALDGSGYPFCHKAKKIKPEVKLVAVCDAFDSLISGIGNRKIKIYEAFEYIKAHAGEVYDSAITAKLLESVATYPTGLNVILNTGDKGVVVRQNREMASRPVIMLKQHADNTPYEENVEVDLMKTFTMFIVDTE